MLVKKENSFWQKIVPEFGYNHVHQSSNGSNYRKVVVFYEKAEQCELFKLID